MDYKSSSTDASPLNIKEMPRLPLRAGRHLTAWILWQTARVSLDKGSLSAEHSDKTLGAAKRSA
jgi:hypothetical protein